MRSETVWVLTVLLLVLVLLTIFAIAYLIITSKSKERLALIAKGMDPNLARTKSDLWIQISVIGAGFCLGLIIGDLLPGKMGSYGPLLGFIFAGAGLVVYNVIKNKESRRKSE